jgi:hypothetical protein
VALEESVPYTSATVRLEVEPGKGVPRTWGQAGKQGGREGGREGGHSKHETTAAKRVLEPHSNHSAFYRTPRLASLQYGIQHNNVPILQTGIHL